MKKPLSIIVVTLLMLIYNGHNVSASLTSNNLLQREWGLLAVEAPEVWSMGITGKGVIVAVIDTGIDTDSADSQPRGHTTEGTGTMIDFDPRF